MSDTPNAEQADYWSSPSGVSWITNEAELDLVLAGVTQHLVDESDLGPSARILDIGTGTGATARAFARAAGPNGHVTALDISEPLLDHASRHPAEANSAPIDYLLGDAQIIDLKPASIDLATSRFGVMFFEQPSVAFANIGRSLSPGGQMCFAAWGPLRDNPWWYIPRDIAAARLGTPAPGVPNAPGPMGLSDQVYAAEMLRQGGFPDATVTTVNIDLFHPDGIRAVARFLTRVGPGARLLRLFNGTADDADAIASGIEDALLPYETPDGARIPAAINILRAHRS